MKRLLCAASALVLFVFWLGFSSKRHEENPLMEEIVNTVHSVEQEFPAIGHPVVKIASLPPNIYAVTEDGVISFNERFVSDRQTLQRTMENDVRLGWHPALGHCSGAQFLAYHESAHLVDHSTMTIAHNMLSDRFGDGRKLQGVLSGYSFHGNDDPLLVGTINQAEALAEAFAAVRCNGGNWAERELNRMLTD